MLLDIGGGHTVLKEVNETTITITCNNCNHNFQDGITGKKLNYVEEFQQYENYAVICPNCSVIEIFNMNLPDEQDDYPLNLMPEDEQINRTNVRKLKELLLNE